MNLNLNKFFTALIILIISAININAESSGNIVISSYSSSVASQDQSVKTNIMIASSKLNGVEILPGEVFSFNKTIGEGSATNGYLTARVLYQDRAAYEAGGGICQVSSTLFNALLLAGCTIIERHRHAHPVTYVPLGLDATIKYGKKDLRMKNPYSHSIFINTSMNGNSLLITIKSGHEIASTFELYTDEESVTLPFEENSERRIKQGCTIYVYRKKIINNIPVERALLYRDFYPPAYAE